MESIYKAAFGVILLPIYICNVAHTNARYIWLILPAWALESPWERWARQGGEGHWGRGNAEVTLGSGEALWR